jgi:predicted house-cleaning noncanonical NTP pyrophosphatase (MazG superfamily)
MELRQMLEELAERLHLHSGPGEEKARELHSSVQKAIDEDDHEGLGDKLTESAVEFENDHPDLADFLRRLSDHLSAGGI